MDKKSNTKLRYFFGKKTNFFSKKYFFAYFRACKNGKKE
jgi:hypothetical protein